MPITTGPAATSTTWRSGWVSAIRTGAAETLPTRSSASDGAHSSDHSSAVCGRAAPLLSPSRRRFHAPVGHSAGSSPNILARWRRHLVRSSVRREPSSAARIQNQEERPSAAAAVPMPPPAYQVSTGEGSKRRLAAMYMSAICGASRQAAHAISGTSKPIGSSRQRAIKARAWPGSSATDSGAGARAD